MVEQLQLPQHKDLLAVAVTEELPLEVAAVAQGVLEYLPLVAVDRVMEVQVYVQLLTALGGYWLAVVAVLEVLELLAVAAVAAMEVIIQMLELLADRQILAAAAVQYTPLEVAVTAALAS
jgi:hypothetical protein